MVLRFPWLDAHIILCNGLTFSGYPLWDRKSAEAMEIMVRNRYELLKFRVVADDFPKLIEAERGNVYSTQLSCVD